ncbi:glycosyltransferase [Tessaracoccus sp. MC1679]|uniref:glycosyltransferase n=1 Tax=Tessaracoccus sp. MC1679 TaxID=2760313 RepID=UPI0015FEE2A7|nr:glycosyltransferase [Tessaracoccus sp. MC1679]MBB1514788.1 glycosyltransferase [Tessaracoccus sp. MC1679]
MHHPVLAIGPANYAGQANAWAQAVNRRGASRAWSFSVSSRGGFQFPADRLIGRKAYRNPLLRGWRAQRLLRGATHVALDGFKPFFHLRARGKFAGDVEQLRRAGYAVALIAHGSDVRSPEAHMEREEWSYYKEGSASWREALGSQAAQARRIAESSGLPVFFSTPDLAFDLPMGSWLPVCLDPSQWSCEEPLLERRRPRVLHLPSRRTPPIKGSQYVEPVLEELDRQGRIEYVRSGAVPHEQMVALVHSVDVVVDQVLSGYYGVAAVEAMAAGRVVVGNLSSDVAAKMPASPLLAHANPATLTDVLLKVLDERDEWRERARLNVEFVHRWHDGTESARRLSRFLGVDASEQ